MSAKNSLRILGCAGCACLLLLASCRSNSSDDNESLFGRYRPRPTTLDQPEPELTARDAVSVQYALARSLEEENNWRRAERGYLHILEQNPKHADAAHRLAILYDRQNRFEESEKYFRKALKLRPGAADIFCDLGYSYYRRRRWADAEMMLKQATAIEKTHTRAHNHLGLLYAQLDRQQDSLAEFKRAGCTQAQAHMNVGLVLSLNDRIEEAQEQYQIALNMDPASEEIRSRMQTLDAVIANATPHTPRTADQVRMAGHDAEPPAARRATNTAPYSNSASSPRRTTRADASTAAPEWVPITSDRPSSRTSTSSGDSAWRRALPKRKTAARQRTAREAPESLADRTAAPRSGSQTPAAEPFPKAQGFDDFEPVPSPPPGWRAPSSAPRRESAEPIRQAPEEETLPLIQPISYEKAVESSVARPGKPSAARPKKPRPVRSSRPGVSRSGRPQLRSVAKPGIARTGKPGISRTSDRGRRRTTPPGVARTTDRGLRKAPSDLVGGEGWAIAR